MESWCIKHVYNYVYPELLEARKRKLSPQELHNLNHLLIGALLINPDVYTFWNMRRELVEKEVLDVDREFFFAKLVLSHKSKSNEAFAYRRWLIGRFLSKCAVEGELRLGLLRRELDVGEMAAEKSPNNYHAVNHRMWAFNAIVGNNADIAKSFIVNELLWNKKWIFEHVSEHGGYHYRQFLIGGVKTHCNSLAELDGYYRDVKNFVQSTENVSYVTILRELLGDDNKNANFYNYFSVLLYDLFYTLASLQRVFPDHESVWYYRRYVIYHIILGIYEVLGVKFKTNKTVCGFDGDKSNFVELVEETGETLPKILKYEPNKVEMTLLYTILVKHERYYLNVNCSGAVYAKRHKRWLKLFLEMYDL